MRKKITVFCGSAEGRDPVFAEAARQLGRLLADQGRDLIYGAGSRGLMGAVAKEALAGGARVTGVNLTRFQYKPLGLAVQENIMTATIQERKRKLIELGDACIALPGGVGTLDELFEALCMLQLGLTDRPLGILNTAGFYDPLLKLFEDMQAQGFLKEKYVPLIIARDTPEALLTALDEAETPPLYQPPKDQDELLFYNEWDPWGELCNYYVRDMTVDGVVWKSVEHYYQAQKTLDPAYRQKIHDAATCAEAKALGNSPDCVYRPDWDTWKLMAMRKALFHKFTQHQDLKALLLSTGNKTLHENSMEDYYWGIGEKRTGLSMLGKELMALRDELRTLEA